MRGIHATSDMRVVTTGLSLHMNPNHSRERSPALKSSSGTYYLPGKEHLIEKNEEMPGLPSASSFDVCSDECYLFAGGMQ